LVRHPAALMALSHNSFIFYSFHNKHCLLQSPRGKNPEQSNTENIGACSYPEMRELLIQKGMNMTEDGCVFHQKHPTLTSGESCSCSVTS